NDRTENAGFESLAIVEFVSEGSYDAWNKTESAKLLPPLDVKRADMIIHGEKTPRDSNKSIFHVNFYDVLVTPEAYAQYVKDYITPNMENQKNKKILLRYSMYQDRDRAAGAKGRSILVMEYRDAVAFNGREAIKDVYKQHLLA